MGYWPNQGLVDKLQANIDNNVSLVEFSVYQNNVAQGPTVTLAALNVDFDLLLANPYTWAINLVGNIAVGVQGFTFSAGSPKEGNTYYGIAAFDAAHTKLGVMLPFSAPIVVPAGGVDMTFQVSLTDKDCAS